MRLVPNPISYIGWYGMVWCRPQIMVMANLPCQSNSSREACTGIAGCRKSRIFNPRVALPVHQASIYSIPIRTKLPDHTYSCITTCCRASAVQNRDSSRFLLCLCVLAPLTRLLFSIVGAVFVSTRLVLGGLVVDESGATAEALVAALLGPDSQIVTSNAQVSFQNCKGFFSQGTDVLPTYPFSGVILSTGSPQDALGPDNTESATTTFLTPGDQDLTKQASAATQDACYLAFDVDCPQEENGCQVFLTYVFASEEYDEFVEDGFLDPFGIFLNGENLALLPSTNTAVAIDTVNEQDNAQFFIQNNNPDSNAASPEDEGTINFQPDGLTITLTAQGLAKFGTNSIKIVIADAVDPSLDSWLFLQGGSFGFREPQGNAGSSGDPHFLRWKHTKRDSFQGECDLVLLHNKAFWDGRGLDVHIRTTIRDAYSNIEEVAIRVGDAHVLEIHKDDVFYNGESVPPEDHPFTFGDGFRTVITQDGRLKGKLHHIVELGSTKLVIKHSKDFMAISITGVSDHLGGSIGMLGTFEGGVMVGRQGQIFDDFNAFGFEWQVDPAQDPILFQERREPQLPHAKCVMRTKQQSGSTRTNTSDGDLPQTQRRQLRDSSDLARKAKQVCHKSQPENFKLCVDDILASGDVELALMW
eukprot:scaffold2257_cov169-Amphora_coffeaeformis.AAC.3